MSNIGIIGGADGPTAVFVSDGIGPILWVGITLVIAVTSVVLGLLAIRRGKK